MQNLNTFNCSNLFLNRKMEVNATNPVSAVIIIRGIALTADGLVVGNSGTRPVIKNLYEPSSAQKLARGKKNARTQEIKAINKNSD